ncbi:MAG: hypothetical protein HY675_15920 [Chloroflexi bacterium]|nr:hypothetical protein [Chloroflexota bacterium]
MEAHPGILFRSGPAGRRPALVDGPDVWEVVRALPGVEASDNEALRRAAKLRGLTVQQMRTALRYYAEFRGEVDAWICRVDEEAERAEAAWRREQELRRGT